MNALNLICANVQQLLYEAMMWVPISLMRNVLLSVEYRMRQSDKLTVVLVYLSSPCV